MTSGNSTFMHRLSGALIIAAFGVFLAAAAAAETAPAAQWGIDELMQNLARVKSAKAKFVERKYLSMLNAPLEFSGTLVYTAPGRLEKYTLLPKPESLVLEHDTLTLENKARNQRRTLRLQDYPVIWAFVESIRSTLAGDMQTLNRFYRASLEGGEDQWRLLLKPTEPKMQSMVSEIRIGGTRNRIRTIEIIEMEGNRSVMTITEDEL